MYPAPATFHFYYPDTDRSTGWTNHAFVLQRAFVGFGMNSQAALTEATAAYRDDYADFIESDQPIPSKEEIIKSIAHGQRIYDTVPLIAIRLSNEQDIEHRFPIYDPANPDADYVRD